MLHKMMEQSCREWYVPLYISTVDFMKAFDRIKHSSLWISLEHCGIETPYIDLLKRLYSHQEGTVLTDKASAVFPIRRGTKRGDPVSSLLFSTVLKFALKDDLKCWQEENKGIRLSDRKEDCLTNLRFADDVLLFSTHLNKLKDMLCDFKKRTEKVGLEIHPSKTEIFSDQKSRKQQEVTIDNIKIEVMQKTSVRNISDKK